MPVVSLTERLEEYVKIYLEEVAPSDLEVVYTTSIHQRASECEHGDFVFETVLLLTLWINPLDQDRDGFTKTGHIPAELVLDGDMEPVHLLVASVWEKAYFGSIMAAVDGELEAAAQSEGDGA